MKLTSLIKRVAIEIWYLWEGFWIEMLDTVGTNTTYLGDILPREEERDRKYKEAMDKLAKREGKT